MHQHSAPITPAEPGVPGQPVPVPENPDIPGTQEPGPWHPYPSNPEHPYPGNPEHPYPGLPPDDEENLADEKDTADQPSRNVGEPYPGGRIPKSFPEDEEMDPVGKPYSQQFPKSFPI